jgi:signal transduction histidine kinase
LKKRHTLFGKLLVIFFSAGIAIVLAWMISHHYLADQPYQKSFNRNIITYTRLIADKMRFDPLTKTVIEKAAGVKIITNRQDIIQTIVNKNLHFKPLTSYISVTKPGRTFYVKYENNYEFFLIRVIDQHFHPEKIDAIIVALIIALIILFLAYRKVQNVFKPMDRIQNMAIEYGKGRFDESLPVEGDGQLAQLTISINNLVVRIKSMLNAKRDLLLAIGHELKTPLSRLRIQVEMLEGDNSSLIENINEMKTIIDQLLEAEKVSHHSDLNIEMLDLTIDVSTDEPFDLEFDPIRLDLAIKNIVNNAKKYAPIDSIIKIQLTTASKELWITDVGPGVSDDTISMLTDAFYRPDESRCRDDGGVGLGLYLVKNIVEAHRAELIFINMKPGLRVVIKF